MATNNSRDIPAQNQISAYIHCGECLDERPDGISPKEYSQIQAGFTPLGIQIWCNRHEINIMHVDFEGTKHPANTSKSD